jgi:hypothetical protein
MYYFLTKTQEVRMRSLACATLALLLAVGLGCRKKQTQSSGVSDTTVGAATTPAPVAADTVPAAPAFGFDQRQDFARSIRQDLAGVDRQIRELASQVKSRGGAVSDRALADIRAARRAVDRNLKRIDVATAANWEQVKQGVNQSVDNLHEAIEGAQPK